jgi:hypothetical protein
MRLVKNLRKTLCTVNPPRQVHGDKDVHVEVRIWPGNRWTHETGLYVDPNGCVRTYYRTDFETLDRGDP